MKIGIIGLGYVGQLHARIIKKINTEIQCYVYDVTPNIAQDFAKENNCKAVDSLEELFNEVEAVVIATPTFTHFDLAMKAIENGKHILCEKPMTLKIEEAQKLYVAANEQKNICAIGFNYRFFEITQILNEQLQIGNLKNISIEIQRLFRNNWHNKENGVLSDLGIHLIDYIFCICNEDMDLNSCNVTKIYIDDWDYDSKVDGKLKNGISFELKASRIAEPQDVKFAFEIIGTNGKFIYDSRNETSYVIEKNNKYKKYYFEKKIKTESFFDFTDSILRQDKAWIQAILGKSNSNIATFKDGVRAQKALNYFTTNL